MENVTIVKLSDRHKGNEKHIIQVCQMWQYSLHQRMHEEDDISNQVCKLLMSTPNKLQRVFKKPEVGEEKENLLTKVTYYNR